MHTVRQVVQNPRWSMAAGAVAVLSLAACGSSDSQQGPTQADDAAVTANAVSAADVCAPFPAANIPPQPQPPYNPPYGDPQQPASLQSLQAAVTQAAQAAGYSKNGVLCAEGMDTTAQCDVDYWNVGQTPGREEECNFFYLRVGDEYWSNGSVLGLTPMVLDQYAGYLGVTADGQDPENQKAGPHTTIAEYNGSWVYVGDRGSQAANFNIDAGKLDAANVASSLQQAITNEVTSSGRQPISPILASDQMKVDCSNIWIVTNGAWNQSTLDQVDPTTTTAFACTGTGDGVGTAYIEASLLGGSATTSSVPAAVSVRVTSDQTNTLRRNPSAGFTADNVVWPTGLPEVSAGTSIPFTISTQDTCSTDSGQPGSSCLHLWVNFPKNSALTVGPQQIPNTSDALVDSSKGELACTIWFTLELDSPQLLSTMSTYGLSTEGYTPHISLAKKKWYSNEIGAPTGTAAGQPDPCNDARLLANGQPGVDPFNPNP